MRVLVPALGRINTRNRDGSEVRFSQVCRYWQKAGWQVDIILPERERKIMEQAGVKADFLSLPEKTRYEGENLFFIILIYLQRLWKAFSFSPAKADLIYIPSDFLIDLLPGLWWKRKMAKARVAVCLFLLAPNPFKGYRYAFQPGWSRPTARSVMFFLSQRFSFFLMKHFSDMVLVLNNPDKEILEKKGLAGKVKVIKMGVDYQKYEDKQKLKKNYEACFVGRLHPQKGIFELIKIWKIVCQKLPAAKLAIIAGGSREVQKKLMETIKSAGLDKQIEFLGFQTGREKIKILRQSRIFLLPSFYESWGMTAVEAMACGLPVVAYDLPVFQQIFPRGMLRVGIGDFQAFSQKVLSLLENNSLCDKLSQEAKFQAKAYDWLKVAAEEMEILRNM